MPITNPDVDAVSLITNQATTRSIKRTINAAILLRAARDRPARPRKAQHIVTFLGIAVLFVCQHGPNLWVLVHHV